MRNIIIAAAASFAWLQNAQAYLDPATGSIILQGLLAGLAGALLTVKLYFHKIKSFFIKNQDSQSDGAE